jgi:hypothetical protein
MIYQPSISDAQCGREAPPTPRLTSTQEHGSCATHRDAGSCDRRNASPSAVSTLNGVSQSEGLTRNARPLFGLRAPGQFFMSFASGGARALHQRDVGTSRKSGDQAQQLQRCHNDYLLCASPNTKKLRVGIFDQNITISQTSRSAWARHVLLRFRSQLDRMYSSRITFCGVPWELN